MSTFKRVSWLLLFLIPTEFSGYTQCVNPILRICTFNIQNFGKTKLNDPKRIAILAGIIRKYDIVAIQEISDKTNTVPGKFLDIINDNHRYGYAYTCSVRTGQQFDDRSYQEQYAFYFDTCKVTLLGQPVVFPDSAGDDFVREPYLAHFSARRGSFSFVLATIHTAPDQALHEIGKLHDVVQWARQYFTGEEEVIVLGDFNASCSYATPEELNQLLFRGDDYTWIIPDTAKTNLAIRTNCAYDRFVVTPTVLPYYTGAWHVDRSFDSRSISDHYPVWVEFRIRDE